MVFGGRRIMVRQKPESICSALVCRFGGILSSNLNTPEEVIKQVDNPTDPFILLNAIYQITCEDTPKKNPPYL